LPCRPAHPGGGAIGSVGFLLGDFGGFVLGVYFGVAVAAGGDVGDANGESPGPLVTNTGCGPSPDSACAGPNEQAPTVLMSTTPAIKAAVLHSRRRIPSPSPEVSKSRQGT
jgi:hypothetical protein